MTRRDFLFQAPEWKPYAFGWPKHNESSLHPWMNKAGYHCQGIALGLESSFNAVVFVNYEELVPDAPLYAVVLTTLANTVVFCSTVPDLVALLGQLAPIALAATQSSLETEKDIHVSEHVQTGIRCRTCFHCAQAFGYLTPQGREEQPVVRHYAAAAPDVFTGGG